MTTLKRKESVLSQHHLGLSEHEVYKMREFTNADHALPEHDCFCALLIHSYWNHISKKDERNEYYAAMGYFFADEQQFYFGYPKTSLEQKQEYKYVADSRDALAFSPHNEIHDRSCEEDWCDEKVDVLAWCEVDTFSAIGDDI